MCSNKAPADYVIIWLSIENKLTIAFLLLTLSCNFFIIIFLKIYRIILKKITTKNDMLLSQKTYKELLNDSNSLKKSTKGWVTLNYDPFYTIGFHNRRNNSYVNATIHSFSHYFPLKITWNWVQTLTGIFFNINLMNLKNWPPSNRMTRHAINCNS